MKIEAGRRYRTRDGRVVKVLTTEGPGEFHAWGYFEASARDNNCQAWKWDSVGMAKPGADHPDIVGPVQTAEEVIAATVAERFDREFSPCLIKLIARDAVSALRSADLLKEPDSENAEASE